MSNEFVHLKLHTEYSICQGISSIHDVVQKAVQLQMQALAITERHNLFSAVKFYQENIKKSIKPIIGANVCYQNSFGIFDLTILCKNKQGFEELNKLVSQAYKTNQIRGIPVIDLKWLTKFSLQNLIILDGGGNSAFRQAILQKNTHYLHKIASFWQKYSSYDNYYIEIQKIWPQMVKEEYILNKLLDFASSQNLPIVATNDVCFIKQEDFEAHEAKICIHESSYLNDKKRKIHYSTEQFFKSSAEMSKLFANYPAAIENTAEIAKRCTINFEFTKTFFPIFKIDSNEDEVTHFKRITKEGLIKRITTISYEIEEKKYWQRLEHEQKVIIQMGFISYFLIVADFINWAKNNNIPVGPGRGSGAGSLIAYSLKITELDPLPYNLLFERFLNPERVSLPDFDIDFCIWGRDKVIDYVARKYGHDCVAQIITFGKMAAKAVVRDVGRILGYNYNFVDSLAKLIPNELGITLDKALNTEKSLQNLYENNEEVKELLDLALKLEGKVRNVGKHAGGVIMSPYDLTKFTALYCEDNNHSPVCQFDKDDLETIGLVKFDFLGLRTLTIINLALKIVNNQQQEKIDINNLPLNDPETFELLKTGNTTGIFQLESDGIQQLVKKLKPDCFEDIIALVALYRPGPLQSGMVDDFINRKHGLTKIQYPHDSLEKVLQPTYGIILYQEQVMQIARTLANYTLGNADLLRRAMGKKKPEEMAKQKQYFLHGAKENNIDNKVAENIFNLVDKFSGYGFNKSHSATYALISYQTAWLKTHYSVEFMTAILSAEQDNTDKLVIFIKECSLMKIKVLAPDINLSGKFFHKEKQHIRYSLPAIKGVGYIAVENILQNRQHHGNFQNLFEFCSRVDLTKVNRRVIEALIYSGALDCFKINRATLLHNLEKAIKSAEQKHKNMQSGQSDLFNINIANYNTNTCTFNYEKIPNWNNLTALKNEKQVLGLFLSAHPMDDFQQNMQKLNCVALSSIKPTEKMLKIAGIITAIKSVTSKMSNDKLHFITIDDGHNKFEFALYKNKFNQYKDIIIEDEVIIINGYYRHNPITKKNKFTVHKISLLKQASTDKIKVLKLKLYQHNVNEKLINEILKILTISNNGKCNLIIQYHNKLGMINLNSTSKIDLNDMNKIFHLQELLGKNNVVTLE